MKFALTFLIVISYLFVLNEGLAQQTAYSSAGSHTFTPHASVIELTVEAIGGGGGGGLVRRSSATKSGGGGGGAYAKGKINVTPGAGHPVYVARGGKKERGDSDARHGENSWFFSGTSTDATTTVRAEGGQTLLHNDNQDVNGKPGGNAVNCVGNIARYTGGHGGSTNSNDHGGGGGGAAGSTGAGGAGGQYTAGIANGGILLSGHVPGNGGVGGINNGDDDGVPGYNFGGGGGGARKSYSFSTSNRNGSPGAIGIVVVSWSRIDNITTACSGSTATITGFNFSTTLSGTTVSTTDVTLNGISIPYTVNSNTQITVTIPAGATSGNVIVSTTLGRARYYLTVNASSAAPASVTGGGSYCYGNQVTLTANGGTLGTGASYHWYTGSCGGTLVATTSVPSYTFIPTTPGTTTYYVRAEGTCNTTTCASTTVILPSASGNLSIDGESASCTVNGAGWIHFRNAASGRLLVAVDAQGQNLGNVTATSYVQTAPITVTACSAPSLHTAVLGRRWVITPQHQPSNPVRVRLYFDNPEYIALNGEANTNGNPEDNTAVFSDLHLSKYRNDGSPLVNSNPHDNCASGLTTIWTPQGAGTIASVFTGFDANGRYTEYTISDFSEFWLHGSMDFSPLPVTLSGFSVGCNHNEVTVAWETESEQNSSHFIIESSRDGKHWSEVTTVAGAGNTKTKRTYKIIDAYHADNTYYRISMVGFDGNNEVLEIKNLECDFSANKLVVYPNPAQDVFTVEIHSTEKATTGLVQLFDLTGKIIYSDQITLKKGVNTIYFDQSFRIGTYVLSVQTDTFKYATKQIIIR